MMGDSAMPTIASERGDTADAAEEREHDPRIGTELDSERLSAPEGGSSAREDEDRRKGSRKRGHSGLYPPKNPGRSTRMIGEVACDLGFADLEPVEEAGAPARAQGRPPR